MSTVTIKVPVDIKDIISETSDTIYVEALKEVAGNRMIYYEKRLNDLKDKANVFEDKYGKPFEEFSKSVPDDLQGHDDWTEWSYLINVVMKLSKKIDKLKLIMGK